MQKKKLKLLLAGLAASTILFVAPLSAAASGTTPSAPSGGTSGEDEKAPDTAIHEDLSKLDGALTIPKADSPCPKNCIHVFDATGNNNTATHTVKITSGTHTIYLRGTVNIGAAADAPAFEVSGTANVTLALETGCNAKFNGEDTAFAGLQVSEKGQLTIRGKGELEATGGTQGGAGIGGSSQSANVGSITILDGTIKATGNCGGAGIGSGVGGAAASAINIKGGMVTATGSDGVERTEDKDNPVPPGPGIGSHLVGGNLDENILGKASGNVIISGGTVFAYGGAYVGPYTGQYAGGIHAQNLSSDKGSAVIYTNDNQLPGVTNATNLNAIIWEKAKGGSDVKKGTVWGNATLNTPLKGQTLELMTGSSLTVGSKVGFDIDSKIEGDASNRIIDVDNLEGPGQVNVPNKIVTLNESDFTEYDPFNKNKEQIFSGTDKDFTKDILVHRQTRPNATHGPLPVDDTKWNAPIIEKGKSGIDKISSAGWYTVTYQHKEDPKRKIVLSSIHVAQRDLKECTIVIPDKIYTGIPEQPEVSLLLGNAPLLVEENDYTLSDWDTNVDVGVVSVGITANPQGNLTYADSTGNKLVKEYNIIGVPIDDAVVTVDPASGIYSGAEHVLGKDFNITVTLNGTELKEKDDYEIVSGEGADLTSAGDIICTIQGVNNYSGTIEAKYTIDKKEITIKPDSIIVEPKDYDGNGEVTVKDVEFDGLVSADKGKVKLKSKGIVDAKNEGHAGEYSSIHFEGDIELEYEDADGKRTPCTNYTVTYNGEEIPLKEKAVINKVTPGKRKPTHVDPYTVNANGVTFDCTIQISRQPGIEYEFKMDGDPTEEDGWIPEINLEDKEKASAIFTGIKPAENADDKHIFFVRSKGTSDVVRTLMDTEEVVFEKLPNPKELPAKPTISYNEEMNPDKKTYTVTIDKLEDKSIEYRIIVSGSEEDVKFTDSNIDPVCNPGTTYIGQIRYKETEVYKAGDPVSSDEITTPPITPSGPKYKYTWTRIIPNQSDDMEVPPGLQEVEYTKMSEITADLTTYLSGIKELWATEGYDKDRVEIYDLKIQITTTDQSGKKVTRDVEPGDFEDGGIEVTLPAKKLPAGVSPAENQFAAVHMFETDDYAEYSAGDVEICVNGDGAEVFTGTGKGVTFVVNGASPVGIAWSKAPEEPEEPGTTPTPEPTPNPEPTPTPGTDDPTNEPLSDADQDKNQDKNSDQTDDTKKDGTDSQNKDAQSIADALKSAIASLAPKTGDTSKIIMWAVIAVAACIAVIAAVRSKMKSGKKGKSSNAQTTTSAKKGAASAAKKTASATSNKKTTTAGNKSTAAGAQKKTSATAKKSASGTAKKTTKK